MIILFDYLKFCSSFWYATFLGARNAYYFKSWEKVGNSKIVYEWPSEFPKSGRKCCQNGFCIFNSFNMNFDVNHSWKKCQNIGTPIVLEVFVFLSRPDFPNNKEKEISLDINISLKNLNNWLGKWFRISFDIIFFFN